MLFNFIVTDKTPTKYSNVFNNNNKLCRNIIKNFNA